VFQALVLCVLVFCEVGVSSVGVLCVYHDDTHLYEDDHEGDDANHYQDQDYPLIVKYDKSKKVLDR